MVSLDHHVVPDIFIKFVEGLFGVYYNRAVVRFSNPLVLIVIDCLFFLLFSFLNTHIPRGLLPRHSPSNGGSVQSCFYYMFGHDPIFFNLSIIFNSFFISI